MDNFDKWMVIILFLCAVAIVITAITTSVYVIGELGR